MKKTVILSLTSLLLCSGCSNTIALLTKHAAKVSTLIQAKASKLFDADVDESRLVVTAAEFYGTLDDEFIPLDQNEMDVKIMAAPIPQPSQTPGAVGSVIPGIDSFRNPDSVLSSIFKIIHFNTDSYSPNSETEKHSLQKIANYLKRNPSTYIFIEGHCDERGSESYNLALGTKRAGTIRNILVNYGANPNQLYSISYGKEKPLQIGKTKAIHAKNRRACFKIYSKGNTR